MPLDPSFWEDPPAPQPVLDKLVEVVTFEEPGIVHVKYPIKYIRIDVTIAPNANGESFPAAEGTTLATDPGTSEGGTDARPPQ